MLSAPQEMGRLFAEGTLTGLSDADLLRRFASDHDAAAFDTLVARHGPMVLGVCRGILTDPNDAEDAFQATFLILVKKAGALRGPVALGGWLYLVARRVAIRANAAAARRRAYERRAGQMAEDDLGAGAAGPGRPLACPPRRDRPPAQTVPPRGRPLRPGGHPAGPGCRGAALERAHTPSPAEPGARAAQGEIGRARAGTRIRRCSGRSCIREAARRRAASPGGRRRCGPRWPPSIGR